MTISREAQQIALWERLFRLLARRPDLLYPDREQRVSNTLDDPVYVDLSTFDVVLLGLVDDLDRLCAAAVAQINSKSTNRAVLDLLATLPGDRLVAMYLAVEKARRSRLLSDPVWSYRVGHTDLEAVKEASAFWDDFATVSGSLAQDMAKFAGHPEEERKWLHFRRGHHRLLAGLPHDLTDDERRIAELAGKLAARRQGA